MRIIPSGFEIISPVDGEDVLRRIEACGRVCYKSEGKMTGSSAPEFVRKIIARGHESVLEHVSITVKITCDRGVSHELVRHRLASFSQSSTRYCNYSQDRFGREITVIDPSALGLSANAYSHWEWACQCAEKAYLQMLACGASPQAARSVLPNALATEVVVTANLREWRHILRLRTSPAAHPQMREIMIPLLREFRRRMPVIFDDIEVDA